MSDVRIGTTGLQQGAWRVFLQRHRGEKLARAHTAVAPRVPRSEARAREKAFFEDASARLLAAHQLTIRGGQPLELSSKCHDEATQSGLY